MKFLRKTFLSTILLGSLLVTACSGGNGLVNEKEVNEAAFTTAALATPKNTYKTAIVTGYYESNDNVDGLTFKIDINEEWTYVNNAWEIKGTGSSKVSIDHVSIAQVQIKKQFASIGKEDELHYALADNGFRLHGNVSVATSLLGGGIATLEVDCVYNEFGFPTSMNANTSSDMITARGTHKTFMINKVNISYKN